MANTTLDVTFMGTFDPVGGSNPPATILSGIAVDPTDPANVVAYSADDYTVAAYWQRACGSRAAREPHRLYLRDLGSRL